jgi:type VI secretion system protein ImpM
LSIEPNSLGWYGKLPCLGDFISKRLPESFIKTWDTWLQDGMVAGKALFAEEWDEQFLTFPMWRFLINRQVIDDTAWVGLIIPSADRVGRLFPFTVAFPLPANAVIAFSIKQLDHTLDAVASLVHQVLEDDSLENLEQGLSQLPVTSPSAGAQPGHTLFALEQAHMAMPLATEGGLGDFLGSLAIGELFARAISPAIWWVPHNSGENGIVRTSPARLSPAHFIDLVRGTN